MSFAANYLKTIYVKRTPELIKTIHIVSSAFKATLTWHNVRTLQVKKPSNAKELIYFLRIAFLISYQYASGMP